MNKECIKISFIVPVYNVEKYLDECIKSILLQDLEEKEIILINDGSQDNSGKICDEYAQRYSFIKVIHQRNAGLSSARNRGISEARGEYIFFIDSDDFLIGNCISELYRISKENNLDILRCKYSRYKEEEKIIEEKDIIQAPYFKKVLAGNVFLENEINYRLYEVVACMGLFSTEYLKNNNIKFTERVTHEDHEFFLKCLLSQKNNRVMKLDYNIYAYRERGGSITKTPKLRNITDILSNIKSMKNFISSIELEKKDFSTANKTVSTLFYQLTSIYGRLKKEDKKNAIKMIPRQLSRELIKYSYDNHQKIKIILFFYARPIVNGIYKIKKI